METVTIEEQEILLEDVKEIANDIKEYEDSSWSKYEGISFSSKDLEVIKKALACYMSVLTLDINRRKENENAK